MFTSYRSHGERDGMGRAVTSLTGFCRVIFEIEKENNETFLYRGHSNHEYKLLPSVLRDVYKQQNENIILREIISSHPNEFAGDRTTLENLLRSQHYSLPTRLLDMTWNPLVALYFAAKEENESENSGEVVVCKIKKNSVKYYDSDTASCISNLAHLSIDEKNNIDFALSDNNRDFCKQPPIDRLIQFIRHEKPYFRPSIKKDDLKKVLCVKPKLNSKRIISQSGAFLLFGKHEEVNEQNRNDMEIYRIRVSHSNKEKILRELNVMSINESTMFPEIEKAASYITTQIR